MEAAAQQLEAALLQAVGGPTGLLDADTRKDAEARLAKLLAKPSSGGPLFTVMRGSAHIAVRQLAGVLLRKKVIAYWNRLSVAHKEELQRALLAQLAAEPERLVRKAVVSVIAALAKVTLPGGGWKDLVTVLQSCPQSPDPQVRELGQVLVRELVEGLGPRLAEQSALLKPIFAAGLADHELAVRVAALKACVLYLTHLEDEKPAAAKSYAELVPALLAATQAAMSSGHDAAAQAALESITELVEVEARVLRPYTQQLTVFLCGVMGSRDVEATVRVCAGNVLTQLLVSRPQTIAKKGLLASHLLPALVTSLLEFDPEEDEQAEMELREAGVEGGEEGGDAGAQPWNLAAHVLDVAAQSLPSKQMFGALGAVLPGFLSSQEWEKRRAAIAMLAAASQGCADAFLEHLDMVLTAVTSAVSDPSPHVRAIACWALAQFADHLQPRILNAHPKILPPLFAALGDEANPLVVDRACMALECYVEGLTPPVMGGYLSGFMGRMVAILGGNSQPVWVKETVLTALSSVAIGAARLLTPYAPQLVPGLLQMAELTDARLLGVRAKATECLGHVAVAVGREAFAPFMQRAMASVAASFDLDVPDVAENAFAFFSCAAEVLGPSIEPVLPGLWSRLKATMGNDEGVVEVNYKKGDDDGGAGARGEDLADRLLSGGGGEEESSGNTPAGGGGGGGDGSSSTDSEWDEGQEDLGRRLDLRVRTSFLDVKTAAVNCVGQLASHCGPCFGPYIPEALKALDELVIYFHDDVRGYSLQALRAVTVAAVQLHPGVPQADPRLPAILPPDTQRLLDETTMKLIDTMRDDQSKEVVAAACNAVQALAVKVGLPALWVHHEPLMKALLVLLKEKAACQVAPHEKEGDDDDDDEDGEGGDEDDAAGSEDEDDDDEDDGAADGDAGATPDGDDADADHDHIVLDEAADAIACIAKAMGPDGFAPHLPAVMKALSRYARPSRPLIDRVTCLGTYTELVQALGSPAMSPYVPQVAQMVCTAIRDKSPELRRNAAFGIGILLQRCTADCGPLLGPLLEGLQSCFVRGGRGHGDDEELVLDNAVASLARALLAVPGSVPTASAVPAIVASLPLKADHLETGAVLSTLLDLAAQRNADALAHLPAIIAACGSALAPDAPTPPADKAGVIAPALRRLIYTASDGDKAKISAAAGALQPAEREALQAALEGRV